MKRKKGFIAISLIYSFFLVFLMLMMSILGKSVDNRILVGSIKEEIRTELDQQSGFIIDSITSQTYTPGTTLNFANEEWKVMTDKGSSVVLILNRSLTKSEIELNIGRDGANADYFGTCNTTSCLVRMCRRASSGQEYCYLYELNTRLYRAPAWNPTTDEVRNGTVSSSIPSVAVLSWFRTHLGLQKVLERNKLVNMTFSDGGKNVTGYIRLPNDSDLARVATFASPSPFHLVNRQSNTQSKIYNGSAVQNVNTTYAAYIRPVIEVVKD